MRVNPDKLDGTWPETKILINQILENIRSEEMKNDNLNRLNDELDTLRKRLSCKIL